MFVLNLPFFLLTYVEYLVYVFIGSLYLLLTLSLVPTYYLQFPVMEAPLIPAHYPCICCIVYILCETPEFFSRREKFMHVFFLTSLLLQEDLGMTLNCNLHFR